MTVFVSCVYSLPHSSNPTSPGSVRYPLSPSLRSNIVTGSTIEATGLRRDGFRLLQELCNAARLVRQQVRVGFFSALYSATPSIVSSVEAVIKDPTACVRHVVCCMDILFSLMQQDPLRLRQYLLSQKNHPTPPASIATANTPGAKAPPKFSGLKPQVSWVLCCRVLSSVSCQSTVMKCVGAADTLSVTSRCCAVAVRRCCHVWRVWCDLVVGCCSRPLLARSSSIAGRRSR